MNKKLKLTELKVKSFVTRLEEDEKNGVYGGRSDLIGCPVSDEMICTVVTEIRCYTIGVDKCNTRVGNIGC